MMTNYSRQRELLQSDTVAGWGEFKRTEIEKKHNKQKRRRHNKTKSTTKDEGGGRKWHRVMRG